MGGASHGDGRDAPGIGLAAYGQQDPLVVYKREAHDMWQQLLANIRRQITHSIYHVELAPRTARPPVAAEAPEGEEAAAETAAVSKAAARRSRVAVAAGGRAAGRRPVGAHKVGRNDPCPCGSGKKYKKCCGGAA